MEAYYLRAVSQACPGMFSEDHIRFHLPQERGWAYIHDHHVSLGIATEWPGAAPSGPSATQLAAKYARS